MLATIKRMAKRIGSAATCKWVSRATVATDLRSLGMSAGATVIVHSSMSQLGFVRGGPNAVIQALLDVLGKDGTLVMPTHTWEAVANGCRTFDVAQSPSCVGLLSERFRLHPGTTRSLHPTHSIAAWGRNAKWLVEGHEKACTPCGPGTPYDKLLKLHSLVLLIGVALDKNTLFHTLESMACYPKLLEAEAKQFSIIDSAGVRQAIAFHLHRPGIRRRYCEMNGLLTNAGAIRCGKIGNADSSIIDARAMATAMRPILADDPSFLEII